MKSCIKTIKNTELQLAKEKHLNRMKSHALSEVSHQFRTPLSIILSSTELLNMYIGQTQDAELSHKAFIHLNNIVSQVHRLTNIVTDSLNLDESIESELLVKKEMIQIKKFLEKIADEFDEVYEDRGIKLFLPPSEKQIVSDRLILRQILNQLIENAFKFSEHSAQNPEIHLSYFEHHFLISVKDYGIGIPDSKKRELLAISPKTKNILQPHNISLGLDIAKEFTQQLNGELSLSSQEQAGTIFMIKLPYVLV